MVARKNLCKPLDEGGIGLRYLISINEASNLKLAWNIFNSFDNWFALLRHRIFRINNFI